MKKIYILFLTLIALAGKTQTTWGDSLALQLTATPQVSPLQITLNWPSDPDASTYVVFRKLKTSTSWGAPIATLASGSTSYTDAAILANTLYDYKVNMTSSSTPVKVGYLNSGVEVIAYSNHGIAIVVIEDTYLSNSTYQLAVNRFVKDLELDGWYPKTINVNSGDAVNAVKTLIINKYNEHPSKTKMLILLGHVPIPHSGDLNPDGHPDHQGAWPADMYYADMDGIWNDIAVNDVTSANPKNHNVPGDGNFDEDYIPSDIELEVGRIDFYDLPAFSESEETLMLNYLSKDHAFKTNEFTVQEKGLIDDNFTSYSEGFSQNGYRNFAPLVGSFINGDYFGDMNPSSSSTYLWSYGCGPGTYTSAGGIGSSTDFTIDSLNGVFTMLFGSYFGDWDYTNAFLRMPLGSGNTLTNCWAGRPNWHFYHMAMGETIGYSTRLTQNNNALYTPSTLAGLARMVTINLMGDPSLRMHYLEVPGAVTAVSSGSSVTLNWAASSIGKYHIYRRYVDSIDFVKLTLSPITVTSFIDNTLPVAGNVIYYVKSVELKTSPSGSYYNESLATADTATSTVGILSIQNSIALSLYPNPATSVLNLVSDALQNGFQFEIIDIQGKICLTNYSTQNTIDVSDLVPGLYHITVKTTAGKSRLRFIKE